MIITKTNNSSTSEQSYGEVAVADTLDTVVAASITSSNTYDSSIMTMEVYLKSSFDTTGTYGLVSSTLLKIGGTTSGLTMYKSIVGIDLSQVSIADGYKLTSATLTLTKTGSSLGSSMTANNISYSFANTTVDIDITSIMSGTTAYVTLDATAGNVASFTMTPTLTVEIEPKYLYATLSAEATDTVAVGQKYVTSSNGAGTCIVNIRNRKLNATKSLISLGGLKLPLDLSMSYKNLSESINALTTDICTYMPYGWKLNYQQYVYASGTGYTYIDGQYNAYSFVPAKTTSGTDSSSIYYDANGSGMVLTVGSSIVISDGANTRLTFTNGMLTSILQKVSVTTSLTTFMSYTDGKLTTITDGMGRVATVSYSNNIVSSITCEGCTATLTNSSGYLTSLVDYNGMQCSYIYNSYNYLYKLIDSTQNAIVLYYTNYGVSTMGDAVLIDGALSFTRKQALTQGTEYCTVAVGTYHNNAWVSSVTYRYYYDSYCQCLGAVEFANSTIVGDFIPTDSGDVNIAYIDADTTMYGCVNQSLIGTGTEYTAGDETFMLLNSNILISYGYSIVGAGSFSLADFIANGIAHQQSNAYLWYNNKRSLMVSTALSYAKLHIGQNGYDMSQLNFATVTVSDGTETINEYIVTDSTTTVNQYIEGTLYSSAVYNSYGQKASSTSNKGVVTSYTYNMYGNISTISTTDVDYVSIVVERYTYISDYTTSGHDEAEMWSLTEDTIIPQPMDGAYCESMVAYTDGVASTITLEYNQGTGQLMCSTSPLGVTTAYSYNDNMYPQSMSATIGGVANANTYSYSDHMLSGATHNCSTFGYIYDSYNRVTGVTAAGNNLVQYAYSSSGSNTSVQCTYGNGDDTTTTYDKYGRVCQLLSGATSLAEYTYLDENSKNNSNAKLTQAIDNCSNLRYDYVYNSDDQLSVINVYDESTESAVFKGYMSGISYTNNKPAYIISSGLTDQIIQTTIEYATDSALDTAITNSTTYLGERNDLSTGWSSQQTYDDYGRVVNKKICYYLEAAVHETDIGYNVAGNPISFSRKVPTWGTNYNTETDTLTYDASGNITKVVTKDNSDNTTGTVIYIYDALGRLTGEYNSPLCRAYLYVYNAGGNLVSQSVYLYNATSATDNLEYLYTRNYSYTASWTDQLTSYNGSSISYDNAGNPTTYLGGTMSWTRGRLLNNYTPSGATYSTTCLYDANGIRYEKATPVGSNTIKTTTYTLQGTNILQEKSVITDQDDTISSTTIQYVYTHHGLVGMQYNNTKYYYMYNVLGDIVAICNQSGDKLATYTYDAWGNHTVCDGSGTDVSEDGTHIANINPFRYRGYYYDADLDLYYLNSRYYDPNTGRFINADTIDYLDPESINGLNLYAYCLNNPIMYVDPTGHLPEWLGWLAVGVLTIVGAGLVLGAGAMILAGTIAAKGIVASAMICGGVGIIGGMSISMSNQSSNAVNPWSVATSGVLSGIIGAVAGVASYYLAGLGSGLGASVGLQSSSVVHISSGLNIFTTFGISSAMATSIGAFTGAAIGGFVGGFTINYVSNKVTQELGLNSYLMETPSYVSSWIIKLFQLMYS